MYLIIHMIHADNVNFCGFKYISATGMYFLYDQYD